MVVGPDSQDRTLFINYIRMFQSGRMIMRKMIFIMVLVYIVIGMSGTCFSETVDVQISGYDDGKRVTKQIDYKEALLFAKREAIERAGVKIEAMTTVKDMVVNSDYIESKADAVLLPGYKIVDVGYQQDGTYLIILIGQVRTISEGIDSKELRYAKSLINRGQKKKAGEIIDDIIKNSKEDDAVAEAMYSQVLWGFSKDPVDTFERLKAYYPNSIHAKRLEAYFEEKKRKKEAKAKKLELKIGRIAGREGRFIAGDKGIVLDTKNGLMWASKDNGKDITWNDAKKYCEDYRGGGYQDWRMPTIDELMMLYDAGSEGYAQECCKTCAKVRITRLITLTCFGPWSSGKSKKGVAYLRFTNGKQSLTSGPSALYHRALPVRNDR